ncbi:histone deacetylase [Acidianus sp. HS-5]|uniref:histone deacetylase family protein n=1 Tax=Acidianus sp. HS-5 TaxID=2886040 RepID=UPI001F3B458E|nr:histone deacetylase [Acidianus sp. HS-5]BDC17237.1 acetoin utilization protein [Acidianus sp. HS-5]
MIGVVWDDRFLEISFSHPMIRDVAKARIRKFKEYLEKVRDDVLFITPEPAREEDLLIVHSRKYVEKLKEASKSPYIGFLDDGDTVYYPDMFNDILLVLGSSFTAIKFSSFLDFIYVPLGGFHHALPCRAMGFCPINDIAITAKILSEKYKVAILDVDAHHGNGVQKILYNDEILKMNIFGYDGHFFPGDGRMEEVGEGKGKGVNLNVQLPKGSGDDAFAEALKITQVLEDFHPDYLLVNAGVDGHKDDSLHFLNLTANSFNYLGQKVRRLQKELRFKVISYGGGGYGESSALCMFEYILGYLGKKDDPEEKSSGNVEEVRDNVDKLLKTFYTVYIRNNS